MKKILIIGGGFGGLECALGLANQPGIDVTLIDRTNHHLFQPLLYQVASASLTAPDIAQSIRQILCDASNVTVLMDEITQLDAAEHTATSATGHVHHYDYLVLAQHTLCLKSLADAQDIRRTVLTNLEKAEMSTDPAERQRLMTIAIVGGGPTGVELAGAFADLMNRSLRNNFRNIDTTVLRIVLIEGSERILEAYSQDQSAYARRRLEKLGVNVRCNTRVTDIQPQMLHFKEGEPLAAAAIIWAAGVAASSLTAQLTTPTDRGGRIAPLPDLSVPGCPHAFVAGDLVSLLDAKQQPIPGIAPAAMQMGRHIAKIICKEISSRDPIDVAARPAFRYTDKGFMAIIGKNHAVVKSGGIELQGFIAWLMWLFIHILFLVGFRNKLAVLLGWAFAYLRDNPSARVVAQAVDLSRIAPANHAK